MPDADTDLVSGNEPSLEDEDSPGVDWATIKRRILLFLVAFWVFAGAMSVLLPADPRFFEILVGLPSLVLAVAWCHADASERDYRIGAFMRLALIFLFLLAFPVYVFRTRGLWGFKTLALAVLLVAAMGVCEFGAAFVTAFLLDYGGFIE